MFNKKAQTTLEYAIVIAFVVGALLAMQVYMKRGVMGRLRKNADQIGEQYSAGNTTATYKITQEQEITQDTFGTVAKGVSKHEITTAGERVRKTEAPETITKTLKAEEQEGIFSH